MSESEYIAEREPEDSLPLSRADELTKRLDGRAPSEREGLPRNYRMRADAHYVEQLGAPAQPVIRLIALSQIDCQELPPAEQIEPLTKSIAAHGMLQPLLVRRVGGRFSLIAGRKRLAAAVAAKLNAVPCLLHDADPPAAAAIAAADNLRMDALPSRAADAERRMPPALLNALGGELATIRTSISLLRTSRGGLAQQVGTDLIEAQASRAAWLAGCMQPAFDNGRLVPLGAILQRVIDGFAAHARLAGLQLDSAVTAEASTWLLPEEATLAAINGGLFAALFYLDDLPNPRVELNAAAPLGRTLTIEVIQRSVRITPPSSDVNVADLDPVRPEALIPALALHLARNVAATQRGSAELAPLPGQGSVLRLTYSRAELA